MRLFTRVCAASLLIVFALCLALWAQIRDKWNQYGVGTYAKHRMQSVFKETQVEYLPALPGKTGDKVIIMAKMPTEDTSWVRDELGDWQAAIYVVPSTSPQESDIPTSSNDSSSILSTPANKGHEAMAYLTYIIDNYDNLPSILAFLHSHRSGFFKAWHVDTPLHSNVDALRMLRLEHVRTAGYANLRCKHNPGCLESHMSPNAHVTPEIFAEVFRETTIGQMKESPGSPAPQKVGVACCAQFVVSKEQVLKRQHEDYRQLRIWLLNTALDDRHSGRVMEFLWHIIFGQDAVFCPDEKTCYCDVYGRC